MKEKFGLRIRIRFRPKYPDRVRSPCIIPRVCAPRIFVLAYKNSLHLTILDMQYPMLNKMQLKYKLKCTGRFCLNGNSSKVFFTLSFVFLLSSFYPKGTFSFISTPDLKKNINRQNHGNQPNKKTKKNTKKLQYAKTIFL